MTRMLRRVPSELGRGLPGWCWWFAIAVFTPVWVLAIDGPILNSTSNINFYVYYDTDSVTVGSPVHVRVVASTYAGAIFEFTNWYNRSSEYGNGNYTVSTSGIWGYDILEYTSFDQWLTIVPLEPGTFRIGVMAEWH